MAAGYSLALWVGWGVTAYVLGKRLKGSGTKRDGDGSAFDGSLSGGSASDASASGGSLSGLVRLMFAAVPAAGYGLLVTDLTGPAGAVPSGIVGALTVLAVFAVLARPLRLTEVQALLVTGSGRLRGLARRA